MTASCLHKFNVCYKVADGVGITVSWDTVEPPNKGHNTFVPCREDFPISEVK